jgi:hypothetical protein
MMHYIKSNHSNQSNYHNANQARWKQMFRQETKVRVRRRIK